MKPIWTRRLTAIMAVPLAGALLLSPSYAGAAPLRPAAAAAAGSIAVTDAYVDKARYNPGSPVTVSAVLTATGGSWSGPVTFTVSHLGVTVASGSVTGTLTAAGTTTVTWNYTPPSEDFQGYLVRIAAGSTTASTAIDVSSNWTVFPRIGYLTDYRSTLTQAQADSEVQTLQRRYHLNALQFYDWMWRHDKPIQRDANGNLVTTWTAWNGDVIAPASVSKYITATHNGSGVALPYSMSYAALKNYEQVSGLSSDWRLKYANGTPWEFEMIPGESLYMFNPANTNWINYITGQYKDQVQTLGFDGVHIDQLGDWGAMTDVAGNPVNLPAGFGSLVNGAKSALSTTNGKYVGMNAVDGYGSDAIAGSGAVDYLYTELWADHETYGSVKSMLDRQQRLSNGKSRVVAAYVNNYDNAGTRYEAETAALTTGLTTHSDHPGFTGPGFVDNFGTAGQKVTFTVNAPETRRYSLNFRYGNATGAPATRTVRVDGTIVGTSTLQPKGDWNTWSLPSALTAQMSAGTHTVSIELGAGDTGYINLDSLVLGQFDTTSVQLANAAFAAMGTSHIELGQGGNMLANPYFPDFSKQMTNELSAWMKSFYDFTTAYENQLYGPDVYSIDSGSQMVKLTGITTSGNASANTVWTNVKRSADQDLIHLVNLLGNSDQWRTAGKSAAPVQTNVAVRYAIGADLNPTAVRVASPDRDGGAATSIPFTIGTDSTGRYLSFTVPELRNWDVISIDRTLTAPTGGRYEAETAIRTGVTTATNHPGYTGNGFVDNFATTNSGLTFNVNAATDGPRNLTIRYASTGAATRTFAVDGQTSTTVTLPSTGSWDTWSTVTVPITLRHGLHTAVLWQGGNNSGAINVDNITVS